MNQLLPLQALHPPFCTSRRRRRQSQVTEADSASCLEFPSVPLDLPRDPACPGHDIRDGKHDEGCELAAHQEDEPEEWDALDVVAGAVEQEEVGAGERVGDYRFLDVVVVLSVDAVLDALSGAGIVVYVLCACLVES